MPLVLLRDNASGMLGYFANYHNPADTARYHNQAKWRAEANRVQIALQNQIWTRGIPRFVTGDMNERAPTSAASRSRHRSRRPGRTPTSRTAPATPTSRGPSTGSWAPAR